ncbi:MAG TPA: hypothetical protein VND65_21140 [Candidatus Binatia bacterium]|nr:hypothetical protein [Candidatus Binatia bacterium]
MAYLDDSLAHLEYFENSIAWMYRDTRGFVTVGVGEMLANAARAQSIAFVDASNQVAGPSAILADYNRVLALAPAKVPSFYRAANSVVLPQSEIDSLLMNHLNFFDRQLGQQFANFAGFPDAAKLGLLDMIFNLGATGLFKGYPTLMGYVQKQSWTAAAGECHRNGPNAERNEWTRQQFLDAATAAKG